ncbi:MAG: ABC transporter ATP-binding protein, partial [Ruminiclostridium sp.]|nr:ABC transporter ATP-binding protein [Ruminiclostridium sp.]
MKMNNKKNIPHPDMPKPQFKNLGRIIAYTFSHYKVSCIVVLLCIVIQALCTMYGMVFIQSLIDDHIKPFIGAENPDFSGLLQ